MLDIKKIVGRFSNPVVELKVIYKSSVFNVYFCTGLLPLYRVTKKKHLKNSKSEVSTIFSTILNLPFFYRNHSKNTVFEKFQ